MNELFIYLIKNGLSLIIFYAFYRIFLQKETFFILNRIYLLSSIFISALIPLISIKVPSSSNAIQYILLNTINIGELGIESAIIKQLSGLEIVLIIYFAVVGLLLIRFLLQITYFFVSIKKHRINRQYNSKIISTDTNTSPFSFFGFIFINKNLFDQSDIEKIISHEKIHVRQMHTIDLILMELTCVFQWFNPVVWFYKRSIKEVHEYIADEGVLGQGHEKSAYQKLILNQISSVYSMELANNFNHSLIKRRIQMMKKNKSRKSTLLKFLLALPVVVFGMLSVASYSFSPVINNIIPNISGININNIIPTVDDDTIFKVVHKPPQFAGGDKARIFFIRDNVKYPEEARKKGITGIVFASFTIEKDGSVSSPKILSGIGSGCDEEVLRVIKLMPKWIPGEDKNGNPVRVAFNIPVKFNLDNGKKPEKAIVKPVQ